MNVFEAVRDSVTARQAAESYGIKVNRNDAALAHPRSGFYMGWGSFIF